jgi:hypothetical protein
MLLSYEALALFNSKSLNAALTLFAVNLQADASGMISNRFDGTLK